MEYVDLGLSVKWAKCNVGAIKPEDYGSYFAWGEIIPKNIYFTETYLPDKNFNKIFKLPTKKEFKELINKCTWTWTTLNGVNGYNIEGPNSNSIFLPAAGYYLDEVLTETKTGFYWSATKYGFDFADCLCFNSDKASIYSYCRFGGHPIRLVKKNI